MEPNPNPNDNTQENHFQIPDYSYSEIFTGPVQNPVVELQQKVSEFFHQKKFKLKLNVYDYNINEEVKQPIKYCDKKSGT